MNAALYKLGLRLSRIKYVRQAIDERADLSEFRKRPTFRILLGVFLIVFSFVMCWPVFFALSSLAIHYRQPRLMVLWPPIYFSSHLCFLGGMALSGAEYSQYFLKWASRKGVERLLSFGPAPAEQEVEVP